MHGIGMVSEGMITDACTLIPGFFSMIQQGVSPLYIACVKGHDEVVQLLLDRGASVDLQTKVEYRLSSSAWHWNGLSHLKAWQVMHCMFSSVAAWKEAYSVWSIWYCTRPRLEHKKGTCIVDLIFQKCVVIFIVCFVYSSSTSLLFWQPVLEDVHTLQVCWLRLEQTSTAKTKYFTRHCIYSVLLRV